MNVGQAVYRAMLDTAEEMLDDQERSIPPEWDLVRATSSMSYTAYVDLCGPDGRCEIVVVCFNEFGRARHSWEFTRDGLEKTSGIEL